MFPVRYGLKFQILLRRNSWQGFWFSRRRLWRMSRMSSSGMWCRVVLVRIDILEESIAPIFRVKRIQETKNFSSSCKLLLTLFLAHWFFSPWWWRQYIPPKRRFLQESDGVISQKSAFFKKFLLQRGSAYKINCYLPAECFPRQFCRPATCNVCLCPSVWAASHIGSYKLHHSTRHRWKQSHVFAYIATHSRSQSWNHTALCLISPQSRP
jgi:hypothetical protein